MKSAVITVPTPTDPLIVSKFPPPITNKQIPIIIQTISVSMRSYLNFHIFHLLYITRATASYVETPRSAVIYKERERQIETMPTARKTTLIQREGRAIRSVSRS